MHVFVFVFIRKQRGGWERAFLNFYPHNSAVQDSEARSSDDFNLFNYSSASQFKYYIFPRLLKA